jgi:hypothetical protein
MNRDDCLDCQSCILRVVLSLFCLLLTLCRKGFGTSTCGEAFELSRVLDRAWMEHWPQHAMTVQRSQRASSRQQHPLRLRIKRGWCRKQAASPERKTEDAPHIIRRSRAVRAGQKSARGPVVQSLWDRWQLATSKARMGSPSRRNSRPQFAALAQF